MCGFPIRIVNDVSFRVAQESVSAGLYKESLMLCRCPVPMNLSKFPNLPEPQFALLENTSTMLSGDVYTEPGSGNVVTRRLLVLFSSLSLNLSLFDLTTVAYCVV